MKFEVLNAGRESINSNDIAAIVHQEVAPTMPDLVVYYEGGNELNLATVVKEVPVATPEPAGKVARWLRKAAAYSSLARRAQGLTNGGEWPKPPYEFVWPAGLDEMDPDITRPTCRSISARSSAISTPSAPISLPSARTCRWPPSTGWRRTGWWSMPRGRRRSSTP